MPKFNLNETILVNFKHCAKKDQVVGLGVHMMRDRQGTVLTKKYILYCLYPLHLGSLLQLVYPNLDD